jgi:hypothetical protein
VADLLAQVQALAERGLSAPEISSWLDLPLERVRDCLDGSASDRYDDTDEASFPASDPPPGPTR